MPLGRRTAHAARTALITAAVLVAAFVQPLAARAATPPAPPSDAKLAAEPARHDDTREQFYFVMPDRFADGDSSNNEGGLTGSRLATGYDPTDKGALPTWRRAANPSTTWITRAPPLGSPYPPSMRTPSRVPR